jgi:hypothetical protein
MALPPFDYPEQLNGISASEGSHQPDSEQFCELRQTVAVAQRLSG